MRSQKEIKRALTKFEQEHNLKKEKHIMLGEKLYRIWNKLFRDQYKLVQKIKPLLRVKLK